MKTTIDKAGRVVIPAAVRLRAGLKAGMELKVLFDDFSIRLVPAIPRPKRVRRGNRWVFRPSSKSGTQVDLSSLIDEERNRWPL